MNIFLNIQFCCSYCKAPIEIEFEVESPTEYFYDSDISCRCCLKKLSSEDKQKLDKLIYYKIQNWYLGKADYLFDE